jgi:putrescine transport system ATP-binding protein
MTGPSTTSLDQSAYVRIDHVSKRFGDFLAVNAVSLHINRGEIFCLLGGSGCGKTTLLRMLAGFETPSAGEIWLDGQNMADIPPYERPINMMFQSYALFPHMSVAQNVAFGLQQERHHRAEIHRRVGEMLAIVKMQALATRKPHQLSGGQRQRVALARALVKRPKLLLLDEPLAALDRKLREHTQFELINIQKQLGVTFIVVTHDQQEAMTLASRIGVMNHGEIVQVGTPRQIYEYPHSRFVADFIGSVNLFEGTLIEADEHEMRIRCDELPVPVHVATAAGVAAASATSGMSLWLALRPEKVMLGRERPSAGANWAHGIIREIAYMGDASVFLVVTDSGREVRATQINSARDTDERFGRDESIYLTWDAASPVLGTH